MEIVNGVSVRERLVFGWDPRALQEPDSQSLAALRSLDLIVWIDGVIWEGSQQSSDRLRWGLRKITVIATWRMYWKETSWEVTAVVHGT